MTTLNYLDNTYLYQSSAKLIEIQQVGDEHTLILDRTIFYPQGGGQPADTGIITSGNNSFEVTKVRLSPEGIVLHSGRFLSSKFKINEDLELKVDSEKRLLNSRTHSAGHLVDIAVVEAGIRNLKPGKGYHFPEGPYVEYHGAINSPQDLVKQVQEACNSLTTKDIKIIAVDLNPVEAAQRKIFAPLGKSARFVYFNGFESLGCGCGGTHVRSSIEIGNITIRKISSKNGVTRVCYQVQ